MKQEQKKLLLKDLCARQPYNIKVGTTDNDGSLENVWYTLWYNTFTEDVKLIHPTEDADKIVDISEVKPYLFPLSSMTEEQYEEFIRVSGWDGDIEDIKRGKFSCIGYEGLDYIYDAIDWFNKNHIDYRGLIPMGLAKDATNKNIY